MLYQIAVFIHLLAAVTWVRGILFLVMVMAPLTRRGLDSPPQGVRLLGQVTTRFRRIAWMSIVLRALTGLFIDSDHWDRSASGFFGGEGRFIRVLRAKGGLVVVVIVLSVIHAFVLGPRVVNQLESLEEGGEIPDEVQKSRQRLIMLVQGKSAAGAGDGGTSRLANARGVTSCQLTV